MAVEKLEALDYNGVYTSSSTIFRIVEDTYVPRATHNADINSLDERIKVLERKKGLYDTYNYEEEDQIDGN